VPALGKQARELHLKNEMKKLKNQAIGNKMKDEEKNEMELI
jgi:hypothetical protein